MISRIIYAIGGAITTLIVLRFIFLLLGANQDNGFVTFLYGVSGTFVAPFYGIFGQPTFGQSQFETSSLVAIVVYGILFSLLAQLVNFSSRPRRSA